MFGYRDAYRWSRARGRSRKWATLFGAVCALMGYRHGDRA